jgi:hypothetical protein
MLYKYSSFTFNQTPFTKFILQFPLPKQPNNMCLTSSPKHKQCLPPSVYLPIPFNSHTPASNHGTPFLPSLQHHSTYDLSPQRKFTYRCQLLRDGRMDQSHVAVSIPPVSHAVLFGDKCPEFGDSVPVVRKVRTLQEKDKTL